MSINILVVDDHRLICDGIARVLGDFEGIRVVGRAETAHDALELAVEHRPHVALVDVYMPDARGPEIARRLRAAVPAIQVIMLTISDRPEDLRASVRAGARGYLLKDVSVDELLVAIRQVHDGGTVLSPALVGRPANRLVAASASSQPNDLTDRELDVLGLVARGLSNKRIATRLGISINTVRTHLRHLFPKLGVGNRAQAAAFAIRMGLGGPGAWG